MSAGFEEFASALGTPLYGSKIDADGLTGLCYLAALDALAPVSDEAQRLSGGSLPIRPSASVVKLNNGEEIHFGLISNLEANAVAGAPFGISCVALYPVLALHINNLLTALWGHPNFMPHVGDVSRLSLDLFPSDEMQPGLRDLVEIEVFREKLSRGEKHALKTDESLQQIDLRLCKVRQGSKSVMLYHGLKYVWNHELGHILLGHVDYLKSNRRQLYLFETSPLTRGEREDPLNKFCEYTADEYASFQTVKRNIVNLVQSHFDRESIEAELSSAVLATISCFVAVYAILSARAIRSSVKEGGFEEPKRYPPDRTRVHASFLGAGYVFNEITRLGPKRFGRDWSKDDLDLVQQKFMQEFVKQALSLEQVHPAYGYCVQFLNQADWSNSQTWQSDLRRSIGEKEMSELHKFFRKDLVGPR